MIALTANTVSGAREMFRSEGFTEFVPKPIERTVLERVLRRVLPKHLIQYGEESEEDDHRKVLINAVLEPADLFQSLHTVKSWHHMIQKNNIIRNTGAELLWWR